MPLVKITVQERVGSSDQGGDTTSSADEGESEDYEDAGVEKARTSLTNYQLARDRPRRSVVPPVKFNDYDCSEVAFALSMFELMNVGEPKDYAEARVSAEWEKWDLASDDEMNSLIKNGK